MCVNCKTGTGSHVGTSEWVVIDHTKLGDEDINAYVNGGFAEPLFSDGYYKMLRKDADAFKVPILMDYNVPA